MRLIWTAAAVGLLGLGVASWSAIGQSPERWDPGSMLDGPLTTPDDQALSVQLNEALDFRVREEYDLFLDAWEPGELLTHARLTQYELDRAPHGVDALFVAGDALFEYTFRPEDGLGNALTGSPGGGRPAPNMRRVHLGAFGGPDAFSCASCHSLGGPDGAGAQTQNAHFASTDGDSTLASDSRNPPHVLGLGPIEALAREMTNALLAQRAEALRRAADTGAPVTVTLTAEQVTFGALTAHPDGAVDTSEVEGVDPDLVVKPFGWKGHQATLRGMIEESFRVHMGLVSTRLQRQLESGAVPPQAYGDGPWYDIDGDGVSVEVDDGMLTTMVTYLALLEVPVTRPPQTPRLQAAFAQGQALFSEIGCASCHRPRLQLDQPVITTGTSTNPVTLDVARDGLSPRPEPIDASESAFFIHLFSDLKRHDLGPELATRTGQSMITAREFLTRPLWGLADTAPYLHDGRAPTVHDAILAHGGEADDARGRYEALATDEQGAVQVFLLSLTRRPQVMIP